MKQLLKTVVLMLTTTNDMKKIVLLSAVLFAFQTFANNTKKITKEEYIETWSRTAMDNMINHKIPASITLAQGILESGSGNSDLARLANNHFGIKCHDWKGQTMYKDDDTKNECFRKYKNAEESFEDHSQFLITKKRYATLFTYEATDYKSWAKGLKEAGYATNPKYPTLLIDLIESLELHEFDKLATNSPNKHANVLAKKEKDSKASEKDASKQTPSKQESSKQTSSKAKQPQKKQEVEVTFGKTRETSIHDNKVKYVIAKKGDTFYKIAEEFGMTLGQIHKYNDVKKGNATLKPGDVVNLHPKRSKGSKDESVYKTDMTILEISQLEGIKVESLMKLNHLSSSQDIVKKGQKVALR